MAASLPSELNAFAAALAERYVIERELGRGGMATVYLARDVKHDRLVALKVLNPELGAVLGTERFLAEIRVTANLQHPHLLPLFDSGEVAGQLFYVMPYVEGESLRHRLEREKQLPVDEAVHIALAVASALDYAHGHGVIHRDLKPENILLQAGQPVVADFGIALAVSNAGGTRITQTGLSLGTPAYMSPEQATGDRVIDGRTDIYSLGAVLYEMLTGDPPHSGTSAQAIIARLMTEEPRPLAHVRRMVPAHVDAAVHRSLAKLPADRFQTAREFGDVLSGRMLPPTLAMESSATGATSALRVRGVRGALRAGGPWIVAAAGVAAAALLWLRPRNGELEPPFRSALELPDRRHVGHAAISADGRTIVIGEADPGGFSRLHLRSADQLALQPLANLGNLPGSWSLSPDARWIAHAHQDSMLRKVSVQYGTTITLAESGVPRWGAIAWTPDDRIVISGDERHPGLRILPASGGALQSFTRPDAAGEIHSNPVTLRDGLHVAFLSTAAGEDPRISDAPALAFTSLKNGRTRATDVRAHEIVGSIDDWLLFVRAGTMWAVRLVSSGDSVVGEPVSVLEKVQGRPEISDNGTLAYVSASEAGADLAIVGERGVVSTIYQGNEYSLSPRISPDGRRIAFKVGSIVVQSEIWIHDLESGTTSKLVTRAVVAGRAEWTPDGRHLVYVGTAESTPAPSNTYSAWVHPIDGSAPPRRISIPDQRVMEVALTPDGRSVVLRVGQTQQSHTEFWVAPLDGSSAPRPFLTDTSVKSEPRVSPDGRWLAYRSNESGTEEVYVRPFPGPGGRTQISSGGGREPVWSRDGRTLYYRVGDKIIAARLKTEGGLTVTDRSNAVSEPSGIGDNHQNYDVFPDGKRFVIVRFSDPSRAIFVTNWLTELRARVASGTPEK